MNAGHLLVRTRLDPLSVEHMLEYFNEKRKLEMTFLDPNSEYLASGGIPGVLAMMADDLTAMS